MIDEQTETIETIDFVNLESNQEIKLKLDKKMIFIYGKNGSGKTTFSRSKNLDRRYVFNEDFIHRNVYIIDEEGAKVDTAIKNNFSQLLIGEDVVNLKKQQDKMVNLQKSITEEYKQLNTNIAELFITMLNYDGITIVDNAGRIRAYNVFIKPDKYAKNNITGGARKRAAYGIINSRIKRIVGVYFHSQDGEIFYEEVGK